MLNISAGTITADMAKANNQPVGASVEEIQQGGAAETAGIKLKDIITDIDGVAIKSSDELIAEIEKHNVGDSLALKVWRTGQTLTITVKLGDSKSFKN
jgi:serine protease Do